MKLFNAYQSIVYGLALVGFAIGGCGMILMMLQICLDVVGREFLENPIPGTIEVVSAWYMVAVIFPPLAIIQLNGGHIIVELFSQKASERGKAILGALVDTGMIVMLGYWAFAATRMALRKTASREAIDVTFFEVVVWPTRWIFAVSIMLLLLACTITLMRSLHFLYSGRDLPRPSFGRFDEAEEF